jgi:hypothetical protein
MLGGLKDATLALYANLRGWRTRRKLVVFQSDDWGSIRMPDRDTYAALLAAGIRVDRSPYDRLDCLETRADFDALMNVLAAHRDAHGRPPVFTFNTVMGNPDFDAIAGDGFERFHHEHLFDSYRRYRGESLEECWREAMRSGLIRPQFHAREHLNSNLWMRDLQRDAPDVRIAFAHRYFSLRVAAGKGTQSRYRSAYWADSLEDLRVACETASSGLDMFAQTFGFKSLTSVACNYVLPAEVEACLLQGGVAGIQTQRGYLQPRPSRSQRPRIRHRFTGEANGHGQRYVVRNALFEPYMDSRDDWRDRTLRDIERAFRFGKPAVICSHRINYVAGMDAAHRDRSLRTLDTILAAIAVRWPEVEFIASDELVELISPGISRSVDVPAV